MRLLAGLAVAAVALVQQAATQGELLRSWRLPLLQRTMASCAALGRRFVSQHWMSHARRCPISIRT